jgi:hypothetical protein
MLFTTIYWLAYASWYCIHYRDDLYQYRSIINRLYQNRAILYECIKIARFKKLKLIDDYLGFP